MRYTRTPLTHWANLWGHTYTPTRDWDSSYTDSTQAYFQIRYEISDYKFNKILLNAELATDAIDCVFHFSPSFSAEDLYDFSAVLKKFNIVIEGKLADKLAANQEEHLILKLPAPKLKEAFLAMKDTFLFAEIGDDLIKSIDEMETRFKNQREELARNETQSEIRLAEARLRSEEEQKNEEKRVEPIKHKLLSFFKILWDDPKDTGFIDGFNTDEKKLFSKIVSEKFNFYWGSIRHKFMFSGACSELEKQKCLGEIRKYKQLHQLMLQNNMGTELSAQRLDFVEKQISSAMTSEDLVLKNQTRNTEVIRPRFT